MKLIIVLIIGLLISISSFAQQGINYKALIKNDNGNALVSTDLIAVQFIIYKGDALTENVYQETHTPTTDENGVIIVNIGTGTTTDVFTDIDWESDEHWLNVQIDSGNGLVDIATTQFMAVPYALSAGNVSGLEALDEGNGIGWRLKGQDPDFYGNIGDNAVDLSSNSNLVDGRIFGATGELSTAFGVQTSSAGYASTSTGVASEALADVSTAMGYGTITNEFGSMAFGICNIDVPGSLFVVGNGDFNLGNPIRSNALTILKNGTITAPSFSVAEINTAGDKALITKEYADANLGSSGLEALDEGNGIGWRLKGHDLDFYGNIGNDALDLSISQGTSMVNGATGNNSTALGVDTEASGSISTAMGAFTSATGERSTAMGNGSDASGLASTAMGSNTEASGDFSTAIGNYSIASGDLSTAIGQFVTAPSRSEIVVGSLNTLYTPVNGSNSEWNPSDRLFVIGNSNNFSNRSNALNVLKDGTITAPSLSIAKINTAGNKALITKEFADSEYLSESSPLVPIAYGTIESNANVLSGTGNFTASINSGVISISVNNETLSVNNTSCIITPYSTAFRTSSIVISNGDIQVRTFNSSGTLAPVTFQFVIYKL